MRSEDLSRELQGKSKHLNLQNEQMTLKPVLINIDVTRSTHSEPDVLQQRRIDENVDSSKHLSDSLRGFTKFTLQTRETSKRIQVVRMFKS